MYKELADLLSPDEFSLNEPMHKHTTFRIGGPADIMVSPNNQEQLRLVITYCRENHLPVFIIGLGSNLLVSDQGIRGVVVKIGANFKQCQVKGMEIFAGAGLRLSELSRLAAANSLAGLEFAEGIPGSLGGAVVMNAGAYGGEMKDVVLEVQALSDTGQDLTFTNQACDFAYRSSVFQQNRAIIIGARLLLQAGQREEILKVMREHARNRREKQPLEYPSAGSVFRRPAGFYVGPMIEELGLKGYRIGGAEVSVKHAGFIVNRGGAAASDVVQLIEYIRDQAREKFGAELLTEIRVVGEM